MQAISNLKPAQ